MPRSGNRQYRAGDGRSGQACGVSPDYCCQEMAARCEEVCSQHPDPFDCPDRVLVYAPEFREFGLIIHDGGRSSIDIAYCPWCGAHLPLSLRKEWFDGIENRGIDPRSGEIPPDYRSDRWWRPRPDVRG